ncbi:MAG: molybdenum cofactor guanylyltransferase [Puniceicoccales bacterium]
MDFSAVILCGGKSRRMGRDKALLPVEGEPLVLRQIRLLQTLKPAEIFLSVREDGVAGIELPVGVSPLPDAYGECGPLGGIATALENCSTAHVLVLAVDMPKLSSPVFGTLLEACDPGRGAIPRSSGGIEPLAAIYHRESLAVAREMLGEGRRSARGFAERCVGAGQAVFVDFSATGREEFTNWNRPEDLS